MAARYRFRVAGLTARERDVCGLLLQGKTNKEISSVLSVTNRTAQFHSSNVLKKAGVANRRELLLLALCEQMCAASKRHAAL